MLRRLELTRREAGRMEEPPEVVARICEVSACSRRHAAGVDAVRLLNEHRSRYTETGQYPFLIGDDEEFEILREAAEGNEEDPSDVLKAALDLDVATWFAERHKDEERFDFSEAEVLGEWPGEISDKGAIGLHKDILTGKFKPEVYLGLAEIEQPWTLPAIVSYGGWNACPNSDVHCALHRHWLNNYGAEITGMSGDVVECVVKRPPTDRDSAIALAWEQYWYCEDIVSQGAGSVANLAATLLNSPYWYFWWD